jgi:hypothetical protein
MGKNFQRALLLSSDRHTLYNSLSGILDEMATEVRGYDVSKKISSVDSLIQSQILKAPFRFRAKWEDTFQRKVNLKLLEYIDSYKPDIVMVYNSEFLLPETCEAIKKNAILLFYLADSPFYTPQNNFYLAVLSQADLILSPDTFWSKQLNTIGLTNTLYCIPAPDKSFFYKITDVTELSDLSSCDILYTGASYFTSWGYKKALFMSKFTSFDFHLYGNSMWKRWFRFFPDLEKVYTETGYIPTDRLNKMFNKARLIPVDGNPGILNGAHLRTFEALSAGALPLIEFRDDIEELLFKGCQTRLPVIKDYNKAEDVARYYLANEQERVETVNSMLSFIEKTYDKKSNSGLILEALERADKYA